MILVTGATGLIGSHLLFKLCTAQEQKIVALYRDSSKIKTVEKLFNYYNASKAINLLSKIDWQQCDVLDLPELEEQIQKVNFVYHCAAKVSYQRKDFREMIQINRVGTANVVNLCLKHNIQKLCYVSSTAAIGKPVKETETPLTENAKWNPDLPVSGYSMSKHLSEKEVWRGIEEGLDAVIVNPSVVFGPGDWNESSLTILKTLKKGMKFYPPGANAFVDARDVAEIMFKLMISNISAERFLCIGENSSFKNMMEIAAKKLNTKAPTIALKKWVMNIVWRIARFVSVISFTKAVLTKESVESTFGKTKFSNAKIKEAINHKFYSLNEMMDNAVKGKL